MRLEEITAEDPRAAFWRDDGTPVATPCLAAVIEPRDASTLIAALHAALPSERGGVEHLKRIRRGADGLRLVLATAAAFDGAADTDGYRALASAHPALRRDALARVDAPGAAPITRAHFDVGSRLWPLARPPAARDASPTRGDVAATAAARLAGADADAAALRTLRDAPPPGAPKCASGGAALYEPGGAAAVAAAADELRRRAADGDGAARSHPLLHAPMLCVEARARAARAARGRGAAPGSAYLCTGLDMVLTAEPCAMCAMALVHSRIRFVVYRDADDRCGALGSTHKVHALASINHRYRCWRVDDA